MTAAPTAPATSILAEPTQAQSPSGADPCVLLILGASGDLTHRKLGGRMVDFAGWDMPVQYDGLLQEHERVRTGVGLFDVSHMGELLIEGPLALECVSRLFSNDATKLAPESGDAVSVTLVPALKLPVHYSHNSRLEAPNPEAQLLLARLHTNHLMTALATGLRLDGIDEREVRKATIAHDKVLLSLFRTYAEAGAVEKALGNGEKSPFVRC